MRPAEWNTCTAKTSGMEKTWMTAPLKQAPEGKTRALNNRHSVDQILGKEEEHAEDMKKLRETLSSASARSAKGKTN